MAIYLIFLIAGVPIWLYCTNESNVPIPTEFIDILKPKLAEIDRFEMPKFKKSEIKLKFTFMSQEAQNLCTWHTEKFDKFLKALGPEMTFKTTFSTKYYTNAPSTEEIVKSLRFRDERGREDVFNFVVVESALDNEEERMISILNWGLINFIKKRSDHSNCVYSIDKFLRGFAKLLGFEEINSWKRNLNQFYLKRCFEMISQLKNSHDGIRIPSSVFESKLKPALLMLQKGNIKEAFDLIDSAFHDPKLMAAAYFPDEHKFAVYLPVYLPLILPILMALIKEVKERRSKRIKKQKTE